jgi:hypothetical protein
MKTAASTAKTDGNHHRAFDIKFNSSIFKFLLCHFPVQYDVNWRIKLTGLPCHYPPDLWVWTWMELEHRLAPAAPEGFP